MLLVVQRRATLKEIGDRVFGDYTFQISTLKNAMGIYGAIIHSQSKERGLNSAVSPQ